MYTGTLINDLIAAVERAESSLCLDSERESRLAHWYNVAQTELARLDTSYELAGVA